MSAARSHLMDDSSSREHGRPRLRRTAGLATMAWIALLAASCGGSPPAASGAGSTRVQAALAYAKCMRSHGVPDFPDPDSSGDFHFGNQQQGGSRGSGGNSGNSQQPNSVSSQELAANHVCNHLLDVGPQLNSSQSQHALSQLVKYTQCMREHGVPDFPDPHTTAGGIGTPGGFGFDLSGLDMHSPQYQAASQACESIAAHAKG